MTTHKSSKTPAETGNDAPPNWLTRPEKATFRRLIADRKRFELPISEVVRDTITDYVLIRQRIAELQEMLDEAREEASELDMDRKYKMGLYRELDRATRLAAEFADKLTR